MKPTLDDFSYSCQKIGFISFDLVSEKPPVEIGRYLVLELSKIWLRNLKNTWRT